MIITTTGSIDGRQVREYLGVVSGQTVMGANVFRDIGAGIRDIIGGRAAGYEKELDKARRVALEEMQQQAAGLGADAVVGVKVDYESIGTGRMLMVVASGTAVKTG